jgi:hypothetical protein
MTSFRLIAVVLLALAQAQVGLSRERGHRGAARWSARIGRFEMKLAVFCLCAALTASAQSLADTLPTTDAEKIVDALRAAPKFITDSATVVDYPASKGGEFRVLRKGTNEWTCLPGPPPGSKHDDPGCFDSVFFQWVKDDLAGRSPHIERLSVSYMFMGQWVPGGSGGEFHVAPTLWW